MTITDALSCPRPVARLLHVIRLANSTIHDMCRRMQNETTGGRGTKHGPLHWVRRLLPQAAERVTDP